MKDKETDTKMIHRIQPARRRKLTLAAVLTLSVAAIAVPQAAVAQQDAPSVRRNNVELAILGGASLGFEEYRFMGGGNVGWAATKHIFPYVEASYLPGLTRERDQNIGDGITLQQRFEVPAFDFNGGLHLRAPVAESPIVPYAVIGAGGIRYGSTNEVQLLDASGNVLDTGTLNIASQTVFAVNGGAGLRYYVNEKVGLRFEFKAYKPVSGDVISQDPFYRFTGAIFFQIN